MVLKLNSTDPGEREEGPGHSTSRKRVPGKRPALASRRPAGRAPPSPGRAPPKPRAFPLTPAPLTPAPLKLAPWNPRTGPRRRASLPGAHGRDLVAVRELADSSQRYHAPGRAAGSRDRPPAGRGRPAPARRATRPAPAAARRDLCRLRNDLLRQAGELPADFDAERGRACCCSRTPNPSRSRWKTAASRRSRRSWRSVRPALHRRVGGQPTAETRPWPGGSPAIRRDGYLDVDSNSPLAPAEVVVFGNPAATAATPPAQTRGANRERAAAGHLRH